MKKILLATLFGLIPALAATPAQASTIVFEFVCVSPADCDGDAGFSLQIMLDSSVVAANSIYTATAASNAGFLGWTAASTSANDAGIPNYNGFSTSGGWSNISSVDATGLQFHFDANGALTGLKGITEGAPGATGGFIWSFVGVTGARGEIQVKELLDVSNLVIGNTIDFRRDLSPTCSGSPSTGCPSNPTDNTDINGYFRRVQPVPEPATLVLLGVGLLGVGLKLRRRT